MTDTAPDPGKAAKEAVKATDPPKEAESFSVEDRLMPEAQDFFPNRSRTSVQGALLATGRKNLTLEEAASAVDKFEKAKVESKLPGDED
jgi:hypothetical protein